MGCPVPVRLLFVLAAAGAAAPLAGCAASNQLGAAGRHREGAIVPVNVEDRAFASSIYKLLRDGTQKPERLPLLVGVVRRQLTHAADRFTAGHPQRATESVMGALYLVRSGEGRGEMVDAKGERALAGAIDRVSPRGDEGRAQVLMRMRAAALPTSSPAKRELEEHLQALDRWIRDTRTGGPMQRLGADERFAVSRALVDPSRQALSAAGDAIGAWIDRAIEFNFEFRQTGQRPDRDEAMEAARALETGAATMVAVYLRHGDAKGAVERIDKSGARRVIRPALYERLRSAAVNDDARSWQALAAAFARQGAAEDDDDDGSSLDTEVIEAGLWGSVLEAYRRDATRPEIAMLLARSLVKLGMSEAAPLVLADAIGQRPSPAVLSAMLGVVRAGLTEDAAIEDVPAARRTYAATTNLLAWADRPEYKGRLDPSAARLRFLMASIEMRAGNLPLARPLLEQSAAAEPSVSAFTILAMLDRQEGRTDAALADLSRALAAPDATRALLDVAEANVIAFELERDVGHEARAKAALDAALAKALAGRQQRGDSMVRARAERLLGRILDGYGDAKGAVRALDRALQAAGEDRSTLGATMLDAVGRAYVRRDLPAARAALKRGLEGDAPEEDLTYGGLWVLLLERELRVPSDGTADRALRTGGNRASWTARLAAWAAGKLSDSDLVTAAQNSSQRVEADFYTALARKAAGDPSALDRLRAVAKSPIIDLLEVQLARELTAPRVHAEPPRDLAIP